MLFGVWPGGTRFESITSNRSAAGVLLVAGLAPLWSASGYVGAFMRASNVIYEVPEGRPFWKLRVVVLLVWMWISNLALLFGHQLNAELERELADGDERAREEIQLDPRTPPKGYATAPSAVEARER